MNFRQHLKLSILLLAMLPAASLRAQQPPARLDSPPVQQAESTRLPAVDQRVDAAFAPASFQETPPVNDELSELHRRLDATEAELAAMRNESKSAADKLLDLLKRDKPHAPDLPLIRLSGFFQVDDGLFSQGPDSRAVLGDVKDGVGFRRVRLQALGAVTEFTRYSIEVDFAVLGRPSFMDVWAEQSNIPFFGTIRAGHFRQPTTMDGLTSVRHLEFLERSMPFQAFDPFRRTGLMAYRVAEDEMSTIAYSVFATGFTFFNGSELVYGTLGDTRYATEIGDSGGISFAIRGTHLLYYDEPAEGRYLLHVGGGYDFSEIGGQGTSGPFAKTYQSRPIPEFFQGDPSGIGLTAAGTPWLLDTGRILANNFHFAHLELGGNYGPAHFQTELMGTWLNQMNGPAVFLCGAYWQCGYFLTGESAGYNKQTGVLDYNVQPFRPFAGTGAKGRMCGWGAWELAFRWSYVNLSTDDVLPENILPGGAGPPPNPNPGQANQATLAINWWWNQYTRVQFNWIHSMPDYTTGGYAPWDIFGTRFQVEF